MSSYTVPQYQNIYTGEIEIRATFDPDRDEYIIAQLTGDEIDSGHVCCGMTVAQVNPNTGGLEIVADCCPWCDKTNIDRVRDALDNGRDDFTVKEILTKLFSRGVPIVNVSAFSDYCAERELVDPYGYLVIGDFPEADHEMMFSYACDWVAHATGKTWVVGNIPKSDYVWGESTIDDCDMAIYGYVFANVDCHGFNDPTESELLDCL